MAKRFSVLVRGQAPLVPRDFPAVMLAWYAAAAAAIDRFGELPAWYRPAALGAILLAAVTQFTVMTTMRNNAFAVDAAGILLGLRGGARRRLGRRRRQLYLPWAQVAELRVRPRRYGARLEVLLTPAAAAARRPGPARRAWRIIVIALSVLLPVAYLVRSPALLLPRRDPPGYRIALQEIGADRLRSALAELAGPAAVPVLIDARRWHRRQRLPAAGPAGRPRLTGQAAG